MPSLDFFFTGTEKYQCEMHISLRLDVTSIQALHMPGMHMIVLRAHIYLPHVMALTLEWQTVCS